ncbi:MAG: hypothetical protein E7289_05285 [Lachnospiraceae bacterium]|nr:hypothetical protein [Lachnospiraceae bacterium]
MSKRENEAKRDRKLEAVAFLRDHEAGNRERLIHVKHILNGEPGEIKTAAVQPEGLPYDKETQEFWRSFRRRCMVALVLTLFLCVGKMSGTTELTKSVNLIKEAVLQDESENLFDFIQQITYTHDYEKINAEG